MAVVFRSTNFRTLARKVKRPFVLFHFFSWRYLSGDAKRHKADEAAKRRSLQKQRATRAADAKDVAVAELRRLQALHETAPYAVAAKLSRVVASDHAGDVAVSLAIITDTADLIDRHVTSMEDGNSNAKKGHRPSVTTKNYHMTSKLLGGSRFLRRDEANHVNATARTVKRQMSNAKLGQGEAAVDPADVVTESHVAAIIGRFKRDHAALVATGAAKEGDVVLFSLAQDECAKRQGPQLHGSNVIDTCGVAGPEHKCEFGCAVPLDPLDPVGTIVDVCMNNVFGAHLGLGKLVCLDARLGSETAFVNSSCNRFDANPHVLSQQRQFRSYFKKHSPSNFVLMGGGADGDARCMLLHFHECWLCSKATLGPGAPTRFTISTPGAEIWKLTGSKYFSKQVAVSGCVSAALPDDVQNRRRERFELHRLAAPDEENGRAGPRHQRPSCWQSKGVSHQPQSARRPGICPRGDARERRRLPPCNANARVEQRVL